MTTIKPLLTPLALFLGLALIALAIFDHGRQVGPYQVAGSVPIAFRINTISGKVEWCDRHDIPEARLVDKLLSSSGMYMHCE